MLRLKGAEKGTDPSVNPENTEFSLMLKLTYSSHFDF